MTCRVLHLLSAAIIIVVSIAFSLISSTQAFRKHNCTSINPIEGLHAGRISKETGNLTDDRNLCWSITVNRGKFISCFECHHVAIFNGNDTHPNNRILRPQCTRSPPSYPFTTSGSVALVLFHVQASGSYSDRREFSLLFEEIEESDRRNPDDEKPCNETFSIITSDRGTIQNYVTANGFYRNDESCSWEIKSVSREPSAFRLTFRRLEMQGTCPPLERCEQANFCDELEDYVELTDLNSKYRGLVYRRCGGSETMPASIVYTSLSNHIRVHFKTNGTDNNYRGFILDYERINPDYTPCWQLGYKDTGNATLLSAASDWTWHIKANRSITETNYRRSNHSGLYRPNEDCQSQYETETPNYMMRVRINSFQLDIGDSLQLSCISDEYNNQEYVLTRKNRPHDLETFLCDGKLKVQFNTDTRSEDVGYSITIDSVPVADYRPRNEMQETNVKTKQTLAVKNLRRSDGKYFMIDNATWRIISENPDATLKLEVTHLNVDKCDNDSVRIYDGPSTNDRLLDELCGSHRTLPRTVYETTGRSAVVNFLTANYDNHNGDGFVIKTSATDPKPNLTLILAVVLVAVALVIANLAAIVVVNVRYRKKVAFEREKRGHLDKVLLENYQVRSEGFNSLIEEYGCDQLKEMIEQITIKPDRVQAKGPIGEGNFARISKATLMTKDSDETAVYVALKRLKLDAFAATTQQDEVMSLLREGFIMQKLNHPNVMPFVGIVVIDDVHSLVFPFMANGSLRDHLRRKGLGSFSDEQLTDFCLQICSGLAYLHSQNFMHCDLACRNVLVDADGSTMKISDFGFAKQTEEEMTRLRDLLLGGISSLVNKRNGGGGGDVIEQAQPLPVRWQPPESFNLPHVVTTKTDVWSFGVVCWEMFTGCETEPYAGRTALEVIDFVCTGGRLMKPTRCSDEMYTNVMAKCWRRKRAFRPDLDKVLVIIAAEYEKVKQKF